VEPLVEARPDARSSLESTTSSPTAGASGNLNIVDDDTKECLGAIPETSISGRRVARELTWSNDVAKNFTLYYLMTLN
jgi:hypothetical protein